MTDTKTILLGMANHCQTGAELLREAICNNCRDCVKQISDINRRALSELSDIERKNAEGDADARTMRICHALVECVTRAFSAALLLPEELTALPPLSEEAIANAQLACFPEQLLTTLSDLDRFPFYSLHLCANKARGAHALLINHYISHPKHLGLFPLAAAMETHRNTLEHACGVILE